MKIISWNVNGIRAVQKKGFLDWLQKEKPDILGVQEIKAMPEQLGDEVLNPPGYKTFWNSAERKGYSGVALFARTEPDNVTCGIGIDRFDCEGRVITAEYGDLLFLNIYFPNGERSDERLQYKLDFYDALLDHCESLKKKGKKLVVSGDYNTAHTEIDLARPKENAERSGFLPIERAWLDKFISHGYVDVFRKLHPDERDRYSWWSYRTRARDRNIGWRIDYHFVSDNLVKSVKSCDILDDVLGSDHCPVTITLK